MYKLRIEAFCGIRGFPIASLWWLTWITVHKPSVADGVVYKSLVGYVDYHVKAFGGVHGSSFTSLWWQMLSFTSLWWYTWIVVYKPLVATSVDYKPLVADGGFYKPLVPCVDHRSHAIGVRWSHLQAFRGIRGSSCTRHSVTDADRRLETFGVIRGLSFASRW